MTDSFRSLLQVLVSKHSAEALQRQSIQRTLGLFGFYDQPKAEIVNHNGERARQYTWETGDLTGDVVLIDGTVIAMPDDGRYPAPPVPGEDQYKDGLPPPLMIQRHLTKWNEKEFYKAIAKGRKAFDWESREREEAERKEQEDQAAKARAAQEAQSGELVEPVEPVEPATSSAAGEAEDALRPSHSSE